MKVSKYFNLKEFACKGEGCCGGSSPHPHPDLLKGLDKLRDMIGKPILITSGFRCNIHNYKIGGAVASFHRLGMAVDIQCDHDVFYLFVKCQTIPEFKGIGVYNSWVHVDVRKEPARWDKRTKDVV